jgi:hypothetical protein
MERKETNQFIFQKQAELLIPELISSKTSYACSSDRLQIILVAAGNKLAAVSVSSLEALFDGAEIHHTIPRDNKIVHELTTTEDVVTDIALSSDENFVAVTFDDYVNIFNITDIWQVCISQLYIILSTTNALRLHICRGSLRFYLFRLVISVNQ